MTLPYYIDLIGKPFLYGGRGPDAYDCYGLAMEMYRRSGLELPEWCSVETPLGQHNAFTAGVAAHLQPELQPEPLDLIMFQVVPFWVSHCGVYLGNNKFIHVMERISVAVQDLGSVVWRHRVRGYHRLHKEAVCQS